MHELPLIHSHVDRCIEVCHAKPGIAAHQVPRIDRHGLPDQHGPWCSYEELGWGVMTHVHRVKAYTGFSLSAMLFVLIVIVLGVYCTWMLLCRDQFGLYDVRNSWRPAKRQGCNEITNFCGEEEHLFLVHATKDADEYHL